MLSGMPVEMLNRMLSRMLSRMLDEISCTIPSRMPSEMLNECSMKYLMECLMKCSVKWTPQPHERTQALYWRFGISGGHPPEPPRPSERKLYIRDLAYQGDTPLDPPVRVNASFISEIWHIRGTPP